MKNNKGLTLIEILIATGIILVVGVGAYLIYPSQPEQNVLSGDCILGEPDCIDTAVDIESPNGSEEVPADSAEVAVPSREDVDEMVVIENGVDVNNKIIIYKDSLYEIVATLDETGSRTGCYPFRPIDFHFNEVGKEKILVADNFEVCDVGGTLFREEFSTSPYFKTEVVYDGTETIGFKIYYRGGDAGHIWSSSIYIPLKNPNLSFILGQSDGGDSGGASISIFKKGVEPVRVIYDSDLKECIQTSGEGNQLNPLIKISDEVVWILEENAKITCKDGKISQVSISLDFETILFAVGPNYFEFNINDPFGTFHIVEAQ